MSQIQLGQDIVNDFNNYSQNLLSKNNLGWDYKNSPYNYPMNFYSQYSFPSYLQGITFENNPYLSSYPYRSNNYLSNYGTLPTGAWYSPKIGTLYPQTSTATTVPSVESAELTTDPAPQSTGFLDWTMDKIKSGFNYLMGGDPATGMEYAKISNPDIDWNALSPTEQREYEFLAQRQNLVNSMNAPINKILPFGKTVFDIFQAISNFNFMKDQAERAEKLTNKQIEITDKNIAMLEKDRARRDALENSFDGKTTTVG